MNKKKLTIQQAKFVEAMAHPHTKNQTQAAIEAGCSPKSARITASKWLTKANILDAIRKRKRQAIESTHATIEEVIGAAVFQMRSSIDDVLDIDGSFSLKKARETGRIDLIKRLNESTITDKRGNTKRVVQIEILSPADARREVAEYIGLKEKRK